MSLSFKELIFSEVVSTKVSLVLIKTDVSFNSFSLLSSDVLTSSSF